MIWSNHPPPVLSIWKSLLQIIFRRFKLRAVLSANLRLGFPLWKFFTWPCSGYQGVSLLNTYSATKSWLTHYNLSEAFPGIWPPFPLRTPNSLPLVSTIAVVGCIMPPPKISKSKSPEPVKMLLLHMVKGKMWLRILGCGNYHWLSRWSHYEDRGRRVRVRKDNMIMEAERDKSKRAGGGWGGGGGGGWALQVWRERLEATIWLPLKMESGAMSEGMQAELEQARKWVVPQTSRRNAACHLDL